jgi:hypothetical protein
MKKITLQYIVLSILFIVTSTFGFGQQTPNKLDKKLTIHAENVTIEELLKELGSKSDIKFSYNPKTIRANKRVTIHSVNKPTSEVLKTIFTEKYAFKFRGNYVIITPDKSSSDITPKTNEINISGVILDSETNDGLAFASIYTSSGRSTITDETGEFLLKLEQSNDKVLQLRKNGFVPLSFDISQKQNDVEIKMVAEKSISILVDNEVGNQDALVSIKPTEIKTIYPINEGIKTNETNIKDTLRRPATFSLYPGMSTYNSLTANIVYKFALNFIGYNRGIDGIEIGALSNINREDVGNIQIAGISNHVGGNVKGFQVAGLTNTVKKDADGAQIAGITNHVGGKFEGAQIAGILNQNKGNLIGTQIGGIMNIVDTIKGWQIGGLANICESINGFQIGGLGNHTEAFVGPQIAGLYNHTQYAKGVQVSGIFNKAKTMNGWQIGLLNVSDTITGIPIGIFSFVKKNGYKHLEIYKDEIFDANIRFTTGVRKFHTFIFAGVQPQITNDATKFYTFGYGIGSAFDLSKKLLLDIDLSSQNIAQKKWSDLTNSNLKLYSGIGYKIYKSISVAGGVSLNAYFMDKSLLENTAFANIRNNYIYKYDSNTSDLAIRGWLGYKVGLMVAI